MTMNYAELEGFKMAYKEQGEGQVVVLLHGFCGSSAYWDKLLPLLPANYRVIAPDLRGHGSSGLPAESITMERLAGDLDKLLQQLHVERAIVLGHSLGGYVTLAFAERYPDKLAAFGLIHSTAFPDSDTAKEGRLKGQAAIREQGLPAFIAGLIPKLFAPEHVQAMPEAVQAAVDIGLGTSPDGAVHTLEGMRVRPDRNNVLAEAKVPVLLVAGELDQIIAPERVFSVSGGQLAQRQIDAVGHMSMVEAPDKLAGVLVEFITAV